MLEDVKGRIIKNRAMLVFSAVALLAFVFAGFVIFRVQKSLAPAPDDAPTLQEGRQGIPRLTEEVVVSGLSHIWDVGFLPDGTLLFTERAGTISMLNSGKKQVIHTIPNIYAKGEGGLLGLAVDPKFSSNRYVYACYNTPNDIRVSRWTVRADAEAL